MRRQLALTIAATTSIVLLALSLPFALLIRDVARDRAIGEATTQSRLLVPLVGVHEQLTSAVEQINGEGLLTTTVYLPGGERVGAALPETPAVAFAREQLRTISAETAAGIELVTPVQVSAAGPAAALATGRGASSAVTAQTSGTAVIRIFVPAHLLTNGVGRAWAIIGLLAAVLLVLAIVVADRLGRSFVRPIAALAATAQRLEAGDLDARVPIGGPREIRQVSAEINRLARRIAELLAAEREAVADLSHRLRTPVAALRLDSESLRDREEAARLGADVDALERMVDEVIREARRPVREGISAVSDAVAVVEDRVRFWSVLAEDQDRRLDLRLPEAPLDVRVNTYDLSAAVDALLGNVFAHTPDGTALSVAVESRSGGGACVVVEDEGPGFPEGHLPRRGESSGGSTGLGLDIARRTAEASGGRLLVGRSAPGGARVVVELGPAD